MKSLLFAVFLSMSAASGLFAANGPSLITNIPSVTVSNTATINLAKYFTNTSVLTNTVMAACPLGNFCIQLYPSNAPLTVSNFLSYIANGSYSGTFDGSNFSGMFVQRSVAGFVLQSGGFRFDPSTTNNNYFPPIPTASPVPGESGRPDALPNQTGTVSMALGTNSDGSYNTNSATSQWFINLTNNAELNPYFTVFGQILGTNGMAVVRAISSLNTEDFSNFSGALQNVPLNGWSSGGQIYFTNFVTMNLMTNGGAPYYASVSDTNLFQTTVQGTNLVVRYIGRTAANLANPATVTVYAASTTGNVVTGTFQVSNQKLYQTINFPIIRVAYTNGPVSFPSFPSASSGLGVSIVISKGPAYISSGKVYLTATNGVVTMTASQPGNAVYNAAPPATGYMIISPK